jgi:pimeloyl-ACP methyl ester carboxylesterase
MANDVHIDLGVGGLRRNTPFYFGSALERRLFGWLHTPAAGTVPSVGLIICNPFGYEAICSHRASRIVADIAASIGIPALRFDYSGTGNSTDLQAEEDQLVVWTEDLESAARELRRITGVEHICLMGFRLGAALALLAARRAQPVIDGIIAIAPILSGRRYLRELRMTRLASMLGAESADALTEERGVTVDSGSIEVSGFHLSAGTVAALPQLELLEPNQLRCQKLLVVDDQSMPTAARLADLAAASATQSSYIKVSGLHSMLTTAPQFFTAPVTLIETISRWLLENYSQAPKSARDGLNDARLALRLSDSENIGSNYDGPSDKPGIREQAVSFGANKCLFGIVTTPAAPEKRRRAVILLNAGADYHIGPNRMYVSLARRWARRGYTVLRMDFAGIGDSGTRPGRPDDEVFPPAAMEDIGDALSFVRSQYGIGDVTLAGLCSGAYHALRAAISGLQVSRVLLINPQNYFWKEGMTVNDMQLGELVRNPRMYRARAFTIESWKRLLSGKVDISYITRILGSRLFLAAESTAREVARRLKIRLPNDLGWELESVTKRGVRIIFVFARAEPGIELLSIQAGSFVNRMGDSCRIHVLDSGDHVFSKRGPRSRMEEILDKELFAAAD